MLQKRGRFDNICRLAITNNYLVMELLLQHEHINNQIQTPSPKPELAKSPKNSVKALSVSPPPEKQQTLFFVPTLIPEATSSFNFHTDGLQQILKLSKEGLGSHIIQAISSRKKFSQQRIYQAIVNTSYDFVGVHMKEMSRGLKVELPNLFESIHNSVQAGIWDGQYEINKRNNYFTPNRRQQQLVSYITEELVKRNIDQFKQQLDQSEADQFMSLSQGNSPQIEKNKQAEQFVKNMQEQQLRHRQYMQKLREEKHSMEVRSMQERQMQQEEKKREHQSVVRRRIERYNEMKAAQNEQNQKIQSQYKRFTSLSQRPLHRQIQQRYQKKKAEEHKEKLRRMRQLMDQRKPMSFEQINEHTERYQELMKENEQYRQQKRELKQSEMEIIASQRPYRSRFYSLVVDSNKKKPQPQAKTALLQRQNDFSDYVKKNFIPKIDQAKQEELQGLIKRIVAQKRTDLHSRKHIEQGKINLQKLHLMIGELKAKNKVKETKPLQDSEITTTTKKYTNYLEEVKRSRMEKEGTDASIDYDKKLQNSDHEQLRVEAMMRQAKAKHKEHYLDSAVESMDIHTHMQGKSAVENHYLESVRAKMAILKKYSLEKDLAAIAEENSSG